MTHRAGKAGALLALLVTAACSSSIDLDVGEQPDPSDVALPSKDDAICDWLLSATFSNDYAFLDFDPTARYSEVQSDDWVDGVQLACEDNALIRTDDGDYDYGFTLSLDGDLLLLDTREFGILEATSITIRD